MSGRSIDACIATGKSNEEEKHFGDVKKFLAFSVQVGEKVVDVQRRQSTKSQLAENSQKQKQNQTNTHHSHKVKNDQGYPSIR